MPFLDAEKLNQIKKRIGRAKRTEVLAADIAATGLKVARVKKMKEGLTLVGVDVFPAISYAPDSEARMRKGNKLGLSKQWSSRYTALTISAESAAIRYVNMPGKSTPKDMNEALREHMGLEGDYRLSFVRMKSTEKESETRLLAAALPEEEAQSVLSLVATGSPAALSLEVASLAALNAFATYGPLSAQGNKAVGLIEAGAKVTLLALFNKGQLCLVRKFNMGGESLVSRIQKEMGVDREVAEGIVSDGSFDISQAVQDVMDPFLRQLSISKDFVERREGCHVSTLFLSGGTSLSRYWVERIRTASGVDVTPWNPAEGVNVANGAFPDKLVGQEARFAAAIGAAFGAFEE